MERKARKSPVARFFHRFVVVCGAAFLTLVFFCVLPLIQAISAQKEADLLLQSVDTALPPPPPPVEEEPEPEEPEEEEQPPELEAEAPRPDLAALELALNPGAFSGDGWGTNIQSALGNAAKDAGKGAGLFSLADLDQRPRAIHRVSPSLSDKLRARAPAKVWLLFIVNERGRVESPRVQKSTDPLFERAALSAIKKWKFEPGKLKGRAVPFRMRLPMAFPKKT